MKITDLKTYRVLAGWREWAFVSIETDEGLVGQADCTDAHGSIPGLLAVLHDLKPLLLDRDPQPFELLLEDLYRITRQSAHGLVGKALAAVENACLDIKAKALGVPVAALLGGPVRDRVPLYWSHFASTRIRSSDHLGGVESISSIEQLDELCAEAIERGFGGVKTNLVIFGDGGSVDVVSHGWKGGGRTFDRVLDKDLLRGICTTIERLRQGLASRALIVDANMHFRADGMYRLASALVPYDLHWLELDLDDPTALRDLRLRASMPIGSCEKRQGIEGFRPYFDAQALDVAIVDVRWAGVGTGKKIADLAKSHDLLAAPHNHGSPLASFMSAQFSAGITNLAMMEYDADDVPWRDELVTEAPKIEDGNFLLTNRPGWGTELNLEFVRKLESSRV